MSTTYVATKTNILNIEDALGEHASDYDIEGFRRAYRDAICEFLPDGVSLALNGEVYAEVGLEIDGEPLDADTLDIDAAAECVDYWAIAEAHDLAILLEGARKNYEQARADRKRMAVEAVRCGMAKTRASELSGVSRPTLDKWLAEDC